jgi:hypothetical protein
MPEMIFVDSSNIEAIGYEPDQNELHVRFLTGETYVYSEVPQDVFDQLVYSDSKGSYFNRFIKPVYTNFHKV